MKYRIKLENAIIFILSIIATVSINLNMAKDISIKQSFNGNDVIYVFILVVYFISIKKAIQIKDKRLMLFSGILSILFSLMQVVGYSLDSYSDLSGIFYSSNSLLKAGLRLVGFVITFYLVFYLLFNYLSTIKMKNDKKDSNIGVKGFIVIWVFILLAWIPYILTYFPGILSPDSMDQILQTIGVNELSNHHPIFHTFLIYIFINLGKDISSYQLGVALYSIFQMLAMSGIFSFTIYYMSKKNVNIWIIIATCVFYALYPVNAMYSITMWKDILFAGTMLLFTICMTELIINKENFLNSKFKNSLFVLSMLLVILLRNNGVYVVILTMPFVLYFIRGYYKKLFTLFSIVIVFYIIIQNPVFYILNIEKGGGIREIMSIPIQQLARVERDRDLTVEEKTEIYKFLPTENLATLYNPRLSDPVKVYFDENAFKEDKMGFIKIWLKLFIENPGVYIEAFLCNNYGYWYPETAYWIVERGMAQSNEIQIYKQPLINGTLVGYMDGLIDMRQMPVLSMAFSIGFTFWIIFVCFIYFIYKRDYKYCLIYIPVLLLWLTTLASPVHGEYRYVYSMFTCLPILISTVYLSKQEKE